MQFSMGKLCKLCLLALATVATAAPTHAGPFVTSSISANIGGSGYDAIDFFYESSPDADFTNYRLDFGTTNGALIYDPLPGDRQSTGGQAIDTFMNTVGSFLGVENATHIFQYYKPGSASSGPTSTDRIGWDVFDLLAGDTNSFGGNTAPYHMARVLVQPDAMWHATFKAYDTASPGVGATHNFTNDAGWTFPQPVTPPPVNPLPPQPKLPDPPAPPPVDPSPVTPPITITPISPPTPPQPTPKPVVTSSTILNVGGSGLNAIDFYYSSSPGAEFTNFKLNFRTDDAAIYDPMPDLRQDAGGDAVDTFMNTVGSLLDLGNAVHLIGEYNPLGANGIDPISEIEWDVFDTMPGDTNNMDGAGEAPYHLARVLVSPDTTWNATFTSFDTNNAGIPTVHDFTNNPNGFTPEVVPLPVVPFQPDPPPIEEPIDRELPPPPVVDPPSNDDDPGHVDPEPGAEEPTIDDPTTLPVEIPWVIDVPLEFLPGLVWPRDGRFWIMPFDGSIDIDIVDTDETTLPLHADYRFLMPTIVDGTMIQMFYDGQFSTTDTMLAAASTDISAFRFSVNGQEYVALDLGVPEPSSALLALAALLSLAAARHRSNR